MPEKCDRDDATVYPEGIRVGVIRGRRADCSKGDQRLALWLGKGTQNIAEDDHSVALAALACK